jgi:hypothetical protein
MMCLTAFLTLATTAFSQSSVTLGWDPSPGATGYNVHYGIVSQTYPNTVSVGSATSATITNLLPGTTYYIAVGAYGALGVEGLYSAEMSYTVPVSRPILPAITLSAPNGTSYVAPANITFNASVTTNGHTINSVQFYNGATLLGQAVGPQYGLFWGNVAAGTYSLIARVVYDGSSTVDSIPVTVTVSAAKPPIISITYPNYGSGALPPATVNVAATVNPNGHTITKVQFYSNGVLAGEDLAAPYSYTLTNLPAGSYTFTVQAVYDSGSTVSASTLFTVVAPAQPIVSIAANSGTITSPFSILNGAISQSLLSTLLGGGRAVYNFSVPKSGDYTLSALVSAPSTSQNSFYVNIDAEPTDPLSIWNLSVTSGFTNQSVTWQGVSDTVPKVFYLTAGTHQLIVRGREPNAQLGTISVWAAPFKSKVNSAKQVVLSGVGQAGHTYDVEATQNLKTWTKIGTVTIGADGSFQYTDPTLATYAARFYRLGIH